MPHIITIIAIVYVVITSIYMTYVPEEDYAFLAGILAFLIPLLVLAIVIDEVWK